MRLGELEIRTKKNTSNLGQPNGPKHREQLVESYTSLCSDRIGSQNTRLGESKIEVIYDKVSKIKEVVRAIALRNSDRWQSENYDVVPCSARKNDLHSYVEREREAMKLINSNLKLSNQKPKSTIKVQQRFVFEANDKGMVNHRPGIKNSPLVIELGSPLLEMNNIYERRKYSATFQSKAYDTCFRDQNKQTSPKNSVHEYCKEKQLRVVVDKGVSSSLDMNGCNFNPQSLFRSKFQSQGPQLSQTSFAIDAPISTRTSIPVLMNKIPASSQNQPQERGQSKSELTLNRIDAGNCVHNSYSLAQTPSSKHINNKISSNADTQSTKGSDQLVSSHSKPKISHSDLIPTQSPTEVTSFSVIPKQAKMSPMGGRRRKVLEVGLHSCKRDHDPKKKETAEEWVIQKDANTAHLRPERLSTTRQNSVISSRTHSLRREGIFYQSPRLTNRCERLFSEEAKCQVGMSSEFAKPMVKVFNGLTTGSREALQHKDKTFVCISPVVSCKAISSASCKTKQLSVRTKISQKSETVIQTAKVPSATSLSNRVNAAKHPKTTLNPAGKPTMARFSLTASKKAIF